MSNSTNVLNARVPSNTLVYVGRRKLRHDAEPNMNFEDTVAYDERIVPHTFINMGGVQVLDALEHAGGAQGCVVDTQKVVREKSTEAEVNAWRDSFDTLEQRVFVGEHAANASEAVLDELASGAPFVIINYHTAGSALEVPMQPVDMLNAVRERASLVYDAMLADLDEEQQLEKVVELYPQLVNMLN